MNFLKLRQDFRDFFQELSTKLPLKDCKFQKYPATALLGQYFGFQLGLAGKSNLKNKSHPYKIKGVIHLGKTFGERLYLHHESRPASFKPIATLQLVHTDVEHFDRQFLLLSSNTDLAQAVFKPYLCERFLNLKSPPWILDVQQEEAHLEFQLNTLEADALVKSLETVIESLNLCLAISSKKISDL